VTPDPPELEQLAALGHVAPPPPGLLDAAREILWSAVAQEMLALDPASGKAAAPGRAAERPADRARPADPDA